MSLKIKREFLPSRLPTIPTLVWWLVLERLNAPGWVWGVLGTLFAGIWAVVLVDWWKEDSFEPVLKDRKP